MEGQKRCTKCGAWKVLEGFRKDKNKPQGRYSWCKICEALGRKTLKGKNNARVRHTRHQYGLKSEEVVLLREYCNNSCYLCGIPEKECKKTLHIDHNHNYPKGDKRGVRGILCNDCNRNILNLFEKNTNSYLLSKFTTAFHSKVFEYLRNPPAQKLLNISA